MALRQAMTPEFKAYQQQVVANCQALSAALMELGYDIVTGEDGSQWWDGDQARPRGHHGGAGQGSALAIPWDSHGAIFCPANPIRPCCNPVPFLLTFHMGAA